jgi:hypothetical protein
MAMTVEELERRVLALEQDVRTLKCQLAPPKGEETPAQRGQRMFREAVESQPAITAAMAELMAKLGVPPDLGPVDLEQLHRDMIASGINPDDCIFSREIIAMRDE